MYFYSEGKPQEMLRQNLQFIVEIEAISDVQGIVLQLQWIKI